MPKPNIYERLAKDMETWYQPTVDRLAKDMLGGTNPPFQKKLSSQQQREYWRDLPDTAAPGERSKTSTWQGATAEERDQILRWESEGDAT